MSAHILLVLDEAENARLISPGAGHEARATAELRKKGFTLHVLVQKPVTELFANCRIHEWYFTASAAIERKGIEDLGDKELNPPLSKLATRQRWVKRGTEVFRDEAPYLESAFIYPALTERRVAAAIAEIRKRPEYAGEAWQSIGSNVVETSSPSQMSTPVPQGISDLDSPATRLRSKRSQRSGSKGFSESSEK
jgi:hypothetical protein